MKRSSIRKSVYDVYSNTQEAWEAMKNAILGAKKSIYWEVFTFADDEIGHPFFDILEQKARAGVDVKVIIDSLGTFWFAKPRVESLKAAGVELLFFYDRKKKYRGWWKRMWERTHRKILIVDEQIGFIGGVNVEKRMENWLDIHVRVEGKVVRSLLRSFAKMYIICGGEKHKIQHLLKYHFRVREAGVDFVYDDPTSPRSSVREKYTEGLLKARERVILFSPYYFPDREFLKALWAARRRGVRIDLLIPFRSDLRIVTYASYCLFNLMRKFGVKVYLTKQMMHGKGVVMDDDWAMVGSSNLDHTSFYDCYEANILIKDPLFIKRVKTKLEEWMKDADDLDTMRWDKRGIWHKIKEWFAYKLYSRWHRRAHLETYDDFEPSQTTRRPDETTKPQ
jgi:cardiolipin synthase